MGFFPYKLQHLPELPSGAPLEHTSHNDFTYLLIAILMLVNGKFHGNISYVLLVSNFIELRKSEYFNALDCHLVFS